MQVHTDDDGAALQVDSVSTLSPPPPIPKPLSTIRNAYTY